jgi:hypothetical protein
MTYHITTYSGKRFSLDEANPENIEIVDIAHSLSMICRFNGHTQEFYSVAEHCVHMARRLTDRKTALYALLHDAGEAYYGDVTTPLKRIMGPEAKSLTLHTPSTRHLGEEWSQPQCWEPKRAKQEYLLTFRGLVA